MTTRNSKYILATYQQAIVILIKSEFRTKLQLLDNKHSLILQQFTETHDIDSQFATPHIHRYNAAECTILTLNNQFISFSTK